MPKALSPIKNILDFACFIKESSPIAIRFLIKNKEIRKPYPLKVFMGKTIKLDYDIFYNKFLTTK